jgi:hypothetical protein
MPAVATPAHKKGDFLVDYEEKVFEDVKNSAEKRFDERSRIFQESLSSSVT